MIVGALLLTFGVCFASCDVLNRGNPVPTLDLNDGHQIPMLALGTGRGTAQDTSPASEVRQAVFWAIQAGYRHIDTAAIYNIEREVGEGIEDAINQAIVKREDLFITTKLWNDHHKKEQVVPALNESLSKLKLTYVDLYLIHFPISVKPDGEPDDVDYLETWSGMEDAKELGLAKSIGVSNFNNAQLDRILANCTVKPAVNQIEVNPTLTQEQLVSYCQKHKVTVMAYSPFGYMVQRKNDMAPAPRRDDPALMKIAQRYNKTPEQVVLRYLIDRGLIPIPKSVNRERIRKNIDVFDFMLNKDDIYTINAFNKNLRVIEPKGWQNYPNYPFEKKR